MTRPTSTYHAGPFTITRESYSVHPWRLRLAGALVCSFPRLRDARRFAAEVDGLPWHLPADRWTNEQREAFRAAYQRTDAYRIEAGVARACAEMMGPPARTCAFCGYVHADPAECRPA